MRSVYKRNAPKGTKSLQGAPIFQEQKEQNWEKSPSSANTHTKSSSRIRPRANVESKSRRIY